MSPGMWHWCCCPPVVLGYTYIGFGRGDTNDPKVHRQNLDLSYTIIDIPAWVASNYARTAISLYDGGCICGTYKSSSGQRLEYLWFIGCDSFSASLLYGGSLKAVPWAVVPGTHNVEYAYYQSGGYIICGGATFPGAGISAIATGLKILSDGRWVCTWNDYRSRAEDYSSNYYEPYLSIRSTDGTWTHSKLVAYEWNDGWVTHGWISGLKSNGSHYTYVLTQQEWGGGIYGARNEYVWCGGREFYSATSFNNNRVWKCAVSRMGELYGAYAEYQASPQYQHPLYIFTPSIEPYQFGMCANYVDFDLEVGYGGVVHVARGNENFGLIHSWKMGSSDWVSSYLYYGSAYGNRPTGIYIAAA